MDVMTLEMRFDTIINKIESLIQQGEQDIPSVLSRETGLNLRQLGDVFKFMTQMTLNRYIRQRRIINALTNRMQNDLSVEMVAFDAGFSDAAAFSKACKNEFGVSPIQLAEETLVKHVPFTFSQIISDKYTIQMEAGTLNNTVSHNSSYISSEQFNEVKQILEIGAFHGLNDEEAEQAYRIAKKCNVTLPQAAEFYEDYKLQMENGSMPSSLDVLELAQLSCRHNLSVSESQSILCELKAYGCKCIKELPNYFFGIYFNEYYEQFGEYNISYICEIAKALEKNEFRVEAIEEILEFSMIYDVDVLEMIENFDTYIETYDQEMERVEESLDLEDDMDAYGDYLNRTEW